MRRALKQHAKPWDQAPLPKRDAPPPTRWLFSAGAGALEARGTPLHTEQRVTTVSSSEGPNWYKKKRGTFRPAGSAERFDLE